MSYRLHPGEPLEDGLRRLAADQLDRALGELDDPDLGLHGTVHQARKRCKKLRGLLRLLRPGLRSGIYSRENRAIRDAQRRLSGLRDAAARVETFDELMQAFRDETDRDSFAPVRAALVERRDRWEAETKADVEQRLKRFGEDLRRVRERAADWELDEDAFEAAAKGLKKTYARGRRALAKSAESGAAPVFHEWRKRVKYHLYHVRLLRETWKPVMKSRRKELERLADLLGDAHDLVVLRRHLRSDPVPDLDAHTVEALRGLSAARRTRLRLEALALGRLLFADRPKALARRHLEWLEVAWSRDPPASAAVPPPASIPDRS